MWKDELKKEWDENPLKVLLVTALVSNAAARLMNSVSAVQGRRAYAKQVKYRIKK